MKVSHRNEEKLFLPPPFHPQCAEWEFSPPRSITLCSAACHSPHTRNMPPQRRKGEKINDRWDFTRLRHAEGLVCRVAEAQLVRWLSIAGLPSPCLFTYHKSPMSKSATKSYNSLALAWGGFWLQRESVNVQNGRVKHITRLIATTSTTMCGPITRPKYFSVLSMKKYHYILATCQVVRCPGNNLFCFQLVISMFSTFYYSHVT